MRNVGAALAAWPWVAASVAVVLAAAAAGYVAGRRTAAPNGSAAPSAPGAAPALVRGVIAAHDLAAGADAVQAQLERVLSSAGVHRIPVAGGAAFDAPRHHAVGTEPATGERIDRCVAREIRAGWQTGAQVVRPAEVIVWKR
ncbi:nucleotide exchange factor GrpE [Jidongwangia harbinensis]|uniref:nucleotide exchange factor GrpE n=1 Tax=Jidongwangia harbinensis TaxID=2878561 RepID=UPI001CD99D0A|nr:nucleotide exchange factor GrpE [Jidongwangia harbinensis]MCA2216648.1 nucleotide exchange factor GrpE [Jidongwangia harbinensis]